MRILVVYDSYFGNTKLVAETIFEVVEECAELYIAKDVTISGTYDLIIMGSPTRAFKPTKNIMKIAKKLTKDTVKQIAFFDTRLDIVKSENKLLTKMASKFGYANDSFHKLFFKKGIQVIGEPGAFYVKDSEGPLEDTEIDKVLLWVSDILRKITRE